MWLGILFLILDVYAMGGLIAQYLPYNIIIITYLYQKTNNTGNMNTVNNNQYTGYNRLPVAVWHPVACHNHSDSDITYNHVLLCERWVDTGFGHVVGPYTVYRPYHKADYKLTMYYQKIAISWTKEDTKLQMVTVHEWIYSDPYAVGEREFMNRAYFTPQNRLMDSLCPAESLGHVVSFNQSQCYFTKLRPIMSILPFCAFLILSGIFRHFFPPRSLYI